MKEFLLKGSLVVLVCVGLQLAIGSLMSPKGHGTKSELNLFTGSNHIRTSTLPPKFRPSKLVAKCGLVFYTSRQKICCETTLLNRTGFKPSCCGSKQYDAIFDICCKGNVLTKIRRPLNC